MANYWVRLKKNVNLSEAVNSLKEYYPDNNAPLSRGHTLELTSEQAEQVRQLPDVLEVEIETDVSRGLEYVLYSSQTSHFNKYRFGSAGDPVSDIDKFPYETLNWGLLDVTTKPTDWGLNIGEDNSQSDFTYFLSGTTNIHSDGEHVDIIITDTAVPHDSPEFGDGSGGTRFVQFDWHTLTSYVQNDLGLSTDLLTSSYTYCNHDEMHDTTTSSSDNHGFHVATTAAGLNNGFAKSANVYSITLPFGSTNKPNSQSTIPFASVFYYIRAFHRTKAINPVTGRKNPTIVNCSWGGSVDPTSLSFTNISSITIDGTSYSNSSPLTNGWNLASMVWETGIGLNKRISVYNTLRAGHLDDCDEDGIVIVAAAGNDNQLVVNSDHAGYNDAFAYGGADPLYYKKNQWENAITVGSMGAYRNNTRAESSNFGSGVDVYAPGENILASVSIDTGAAWPVSAKEDWRDLNYGNDSGGNNHYVTFMSGTSMASPQVTGVLACHAGSTTKIRYTKSDAKKYLAQTSDTNRLSSYTDYYYDGGVPNPSGVLNQNNAIPNTENYPIHNLKLTGVDTVNNKFNIEDVTATRPVVSQQDIYGNDMNNMTGISTFTVYEGYNAGTGIGIRDTGSVNDSYPLELVQMNGNAIANYLGTISGFGPKVNLTYWFGYSSEAGYNEIQLRASNATNININFVMLTPPANLINYKHANEFYLADSNTRSLSCESTRAQSGNINQVTGERTSGFVFPRGSKVY